MFVAPFEAGEAHWKLGEKTRWVGEGGVEEIDAVAESGWLFGIATVAGFDPGYCGGGVRTPLVITRTGGYGVLGNGNVVGKGLVGELLLAPGAEVDDDGAYREILKGQFIGVRVMAPGKERKVAVGRGLGFVNDGGFADGLRGSGERDETDLACGVVVEEALVFGIPEQVFVGAGGGDAAEVLLDGGAGGDFIMDRCGTAGGWNGDAEETVAVGHPGAGITEDAVEGDARDVGSMAGDRIGGPEAETGARICTGDDYK
jgi:hypothetical protein